MLRFCSRLVLMPNYIIFGARPTRAWQQRLLPAQERTAPANIGNLTLEQLAAALSSVSTSSPSAASPSPSRPGQDLPLQSAGSSSCLKLDAAVLTASKEPGLLHAVRPTALGLFVVPVILRVHGSNDASSAYHCASAADVRGHRQEAWTHLTKPNQAAAMFPAHRYGSLPVWASAQRQQTCLCSVVGCACEQPGASKQESQLLSHCAAECPVL